MQRFLQIVGVAAILLWTGLGLFAWNMAKQEVHVTLGGEGPAEGPEPLALLADQVGALQRDLEALTGTLGSNFSILDERVSAALQGGPAVDGGAAAREQELRVRVAELEARLLVLESSLGSHAKAFSPSAVDAAPSELPLSADAPATESPAGAGAMAKAPLETAAPAPAPRASFLAFQLPSQSFELDRQRRWTIVESLSRVGFDGKSTLHDFTGATTSVRGDFFVNPARPAESVSGNVSVDARTLDTGLAERDEAMHERLASARFASFDFELQRFAPETANPGAKPGSSKGTLHGRMRIHGEERDFAMPVEVEVDASHRLVISGSAPLRMSDYGIAPPNKLGLVKMDDEVTVWVSLRARPDMGVQ
jgi:polyisoprenoid-binding protein YceI